MGHWRGIQGHVLEGEVEMLDGDVGGRDVGPWALSPWSQCMYWMPWFNVAVTILDNLHCPGTVSKMHRFVRTSQETLCLRYEPNRLMLSIGVWRWYIYIIIAVLDIIHCPVFYLKLGQRENFGLVNWASGYENEIQISLQILWWGWQVSHFLIANSFAAFDFFCDDQHYDFDFFN
jgi:hypothetical protein